MCVGTGQDGRFWPSFSLIIMGKIKRGADVRKPVKVTDLAMAEGVCAEPIVVSAVVRGRLMEFEGRRLRPKEVKEVQLLLNQALPPIVPAKSHGPDGSPGEPEYNF